MSFLPARRGALYPATIDSEVLVPTEILPPLSPLAPMGGLPTNDNDVLVAAIHSAIPGPSTVETMAKTMITKSERRVSLTNDMDLDLQEEGFIFNRTVRRIRGCVTTTLKVG
ncbi:MAG: hypothetical protein ABIG32_03365 [Candidatus Uhrbacteria bacterium]